MDTIRLQWLKFFTISLLGVLVFLSAQRPPTDPDLGWHIRNGADIVRWGAPQGDLYSHTMFGYPWVSHEWLTDVGFYLLVDRIGLWVLPIIFAIIIAGAYVLSASIAGGPIEFMLLLSSIGVLSAAPILGVRAQMLTLLGLAITLKILFTWRDSKRSYLIYWLIPIFLLWANLHGGFAAGLLLIFGFGVFESIKYWLARNKKWNFAQLAPQVTLKHLWLVLAGCGAATLINPYGWRLYEELYQTLSNDLVRKGISEWLPVNFNNNNSYNFIIYSLLLLGVIIAVGRKLDFTKVGLAVLFFFVAVTSWRNLPLFSLLTMPLFLEAVNKSFLHKMAEFSKSSLVLLMIVLVTLILGNERWSVIYPILNQPKNLALAAQYPYETIAYIKSHHLKGKLFNEYNWGGYLVWQLPEKPVFIDGRMAIWQTPDQNIFKEYIDISNQEPGFEALLLKYDIGLALIYRERQLKNYFFSLPEQWILVANDDQALLFQRADLVSP